MDIRYWNKDLETLDRSSLKTLQLKLLQETVNWALKTPFYQRRLGKIGIKSGDDMRSLEDVLKVPYTTKDDLREAYPTGLLAVPLDDVVRLHTSSGTTGTPTVVYHTKADLDEWTELTARCIVATGATRKDVFQNMMSYGLFTGGLGLHYGAEKVGLAIIPAGSGNTARQLRLMKDFQTTTIHATPSYMLHVQSKMAAEGYTNADLALKRAFTGAESFSASAHKKIEQLLGIDVYNSYGLSEMNGPGVAFECAYKNEM
ncbi:MAG TPA: AMP-binding protein, partial [Thermoleophilia bacterium]|nr:AMP-binding protein [Thermoleophilia bacterium]